MSLYQIPTPDAAQDGAFFFTVSLDGTDYLLNFQYNSREDFWYVSVSDVDGNPIRSGVKVVANFPLLLYCQCMEKPPGELITINTEDEPVDPGLEAFGIDSILCYEEEATVP
jgi:hypothetical protein